MLLGTVYVAIVYILFNLCPLYHTSKTNFDNTDRLCFHWCPTFCENYKNQQQLNEVIFYPADRFFIPKLYSKQRQAGFGYVMAYGSKSRWLHYMKTLSTSLVVFGENPQRHNIVVLWSFLKFSADNLVIKHQLPVIWNVIAFIWLHCNLVITNFSNRWFETS